MRTPAHLSCTAAVLLTVSTMLGWLALHGLPPDVHAQETTTALVRQLYDGTWPDKDMVAQLNKERLYQRGIQAYMMTLPALNTIGMRDGSEAKFGKGYHVLPIWKDRMNAKTLVPTPNCDVIYEATSISRRRDRLWCMHRRA